MQRCLLVALVAGFAQAAAIAQTPDVGEVHFASSGSPAAQAPFLRGLAQLHNFEYQSAAALFRRAQQLDPAFAMAYWGEAMSYTHPVWMQQDRDAALTALARLAPTPDARAAKAKTEREKDYMRAVEILYGEGDKFSRDFAFADAMAGVHRKYPDDVDAAAFYALALLGTAHAGRDFAIYMRAAAVLEPLFPLNPNHPGLAHYLIHSYDDPIHAPLGLRAARAYSRIAPSAGHAQHMCSHIFVAMGMWDEVVAANEAAVGVVNAARQERKQPPVACGHYPSWLEYGYLQQGRFADARRIVADCYAAATAEQMARDRASLDPDDSLAGSFAEMRSRYVIDTNDWTGEVSTWRLPRGQASVDATIDFLDGLVAAHRRDVDAANQALAHLASDRQSLGPAPDGEAGPSYRGRLTILEQQLRAMIDVLRGDSQRAVETLRAAAASEESLPFEFGPPFVEKPSYELLGDVQLHLENASEARAAFEKALARTPQRTSTLVGLMRAARKLGDQKKVDEIQAQLQAIWHRADHPISTSHLF